ncbi:MAG: tRNA wybutosine-synthesizing protein 1 [Archaeoglobaceae archaeon]|nr:tRNA wybutosine-synthesizing protein 1 [Archaeoglobaceae archaeon]
MHQKKKLKEAEKPNQVAISLIGEPTLYPHLPELIECYKNLGFTTFLVTNVLNRPPKSYWDRILESLKLLGDSESRTVLRLTLIKGLNMDEKAIEGFDRLIRVAEPDYIEAKAYMFLGYSRLRLKAENMPEHRDVLEFSRILARRGYEILDESEQSRVCLLRL